MIAGRGRSSRTTPPPCGCLRCTRPAPDGGSPGHAVHDGTCTGRRDPAVIGPTLTVAVGQATTVPPARHSTGWGAMWVQAVKLCSVRRAVPSCGAPTGGTRAEQHRRWESLVWPAILRHLGRGHGRSPDHRPHGGCSAFAGGGRPDETWRDRQLYGIEVNSDQCTAAGPTESSDTGGRIGGTAKRAPVTHAPDMEETNPEATAPFPLSAWTRCSCAARHTLHSAVRGRQRLEHSGQRPRGPGA